MRQVNIHEAKTHLSRLVEAASKGEGFIIAKAGKPMVKVVAIEVEAVKDTSRRIGFLKGSGLGEWWDSLDHDALDREIAESFLNSRIEPDLDEDQTT
jgi:prevent-host-death family protein